MEVNGGVPAHIDQSFDKRNQHERQVQPALSLLKSSSFITVVVADQGHMERIDGAAVSANLLGECMHQDGRCSQNKRDVGYGTQDVHPKLVFLAMNFSVFTVSNDKLCSKRISGSDGGYDYHARLSAVDAAKFKKQAGSPGIDVQPQGRPVVGGDLAPALISYNVTCFGPSVEKNHQSVCRELQRPWQEDMEYTWRCSGCRRTSRRRSITSSS